VNEKTPFTEEEFKEFVELSNKLDPTKEGVKDNLETIANNTEYVENRKRTFIKSPITGRWEESLSND
jgi:hypothetical protein